MKLFNGIRNFIDDRCFKIVIYDNLINIINFEDILDVTSNKIIIKSSNNICIEGKDLKIIKLLDNEVLVSGNFLRIIYE